MARGCVGEEINEPALLPEALVMRVLHGTRQGKMCVDGRPLVAPSGSCIACWVAEGTLSQSTGSIEKILFVQHQAGH